MAKTSGSPMFRDPGNSRRDSSAMRWFSCWANLTRFDRVSGTAICSCSCKVNGSWMHVAHCCTLFFLSRRSWWRNVFWRDVKPTQFKLLYISVYTSIYLYILDQESWSSEKPKTELLAGISLEATERSLKVLVFFEDTQLFEKGERNKEQVFLAPLLRSTKQVKSLHLVAISHDNLKHIAALNHQKSCPI